MKTYYLWSKIGDEWWKFEPLKHVYTDREKAEAVANELTEKLGQKIEVRAGSSRLKA